MTVQQTPGVGEPVIPPSEQQDLSERKVAQGSTTTPQIEAAAENSKDKFKAIAEDDAEFEKFATALTGKNIEDMSESELEALGQLRQEMLQGEIDPEFVEATSMHRSGVDKLPQGVRGAFVSGGADEQGRALISSRLRGDQLEKTSDEEFGEAVADRAQQLGVFVAEGDAGKRVSAVARGEEMTPDTNPELFQPQDGDTATVVSEGQFVEAKTDTAVPDYANMPSGWFSDGLLNPNASPSTESASGTYYVEQDDPSSAAIAPPLSSQEETSAHDFSALDLDNDGYIRADELQEALDQNALNRDGTTDRAERLLRIYGTTQDNENYSIPLGDADLAEPGNEHVGFDQMVADGVVVPIYTGPTSNEWTFGAVDMSQASPEAVSSALLRHAAIEQYKKRDPSDTRPPSAWIQHYEQAGMTSGEFGVATSHVLGDKEPLSNKSRRDGLVQQYGIVDETGTTRLNAAGLTSMISNGSLVLKPDNGGSFVGISIHMEPGEGRNGYKPHHEEGFWSTAWGAVEGINDYITDLAQRAGVAEHHIAHVLNNDLEQLKEAGDEAFTAAINIIRDLETPEGKKRLTDAMRQGASEAGHYMLDKLEAMGEEGAAMLLEYAGLSPDQAHQALHMAGTQLQLIESVESDETAGDAIRDFAAPLWQESEQAWQGQSESGPAASGETDAEGRQLLAVGWDRTNENSLAHHLGRHPEQRFDYAIEGQVAAEFPIVGKVLNDLNVAQVRAFLTHPKIAADGTETFQVRVRLLDVAGVSAETPGGVAAGDGGIVGVNDIIFEFETKPGEKTRHVGTTYMNMTGVMIEGTATSDPSTWESEMQQMAARAEARAEQLGIARDERVVLESHVEDVFSEAPGPVAEASEGTGGEIELPLMPGDDSIPPPNGSGSDADTSEVGFAGPEPIVYGEPPYVYGENGPEADYTDFPPTPTSPDSGEAGFAGPDPMTDEQITSPAHPDSATTGASSGADPLEGAGHPDPTQSGEIQPASPVDQGSADGDGSATLPASSVADDSGSVSGDSIPSNERSGGSEIAPAPVPNAKPRGSGWSLVGHYASKLGNNVELGIGYGHSVSFDFKNMSGGDIAKTVGLGAISAVLGAGGGASATYLSGLAVGAIGGAATGAVAGAATPAEGATVPAGAMAGAEAAHTYMMEHPDIVATGAHVGADLLLNTNLSLWGRHLAKENPDHVSTNMGGFVWLAGRTGWAKSVPDKENYKGFSGGVGRGRVQMNYDFHNTDSSKFF